MQGSFIWQNTALHLDIYSLAKPACLPRAAWTRASECAPRVFLAKGRTAWQSLACSNAFPRRASLCSALPPSRLPATGGRALPGWGGGPSRCNGPRGAAAAAGWAVRPGSLSRAPRRCNRTPSARPRRPATCHSLRGAELSDVEEKGSGCRGSPARDSSTKKLSIRQQETSPRDS